MVAPRYNAYITGSIISWRKPEPQIYYTWAAVLVPQAVDAELRTCIDRISEGVDQDIFEYLFTRSGKRVQAVIGELSDLLSRFRYLSGAVALRSRIEPLEAFDNVLPDILIQVDNVLSELGARAQIICNHLAWPRGSNFTGVTVVAYEHWGPILSRFAHWAKGQQLWQQAVYDHFRGTLSEFQQWLNEYPMLGAYHKIGRKLSQAIRNAPTVSIQREIWIRGRKFDPAKPVFSADDMWAPPPQFAEEGRYNHIGKPVLYLASDHFTCGCELVEPGESRELWMQRFVVCNKTVLDLTALIQPEGDLKLGDHELLVAALQGVIGLPAERRHNWKPEYYIPRFVADVTRMLRRFDGIRYGSQRGTGINLVLFDQSTDVQTVDMPIKMVFSNTQEADFLKWVDE